MIDKRLTLLFLLAFIFSVSFTNAQSNDLEDEIYRLFKLNNDSLSLPNGDEWRRNYENFRNNAIKSYKDFRDKCNKEYSDFMRKAWKEYQVMPVIEPPVEPLPTPPVVIYDDDNGEPIKSDPLPIDEIIDPVVPEPQPQPVVPIVVPSPQPVVHWFDFTFFGTKARVRLDERCRFSLTSLAENDIASTWEKCSNGMLDAALKDCLDLREKHKLCDWAYLMMLRDLGDAFMGKGTNEGCFLTAWLYCQSGYQMRFADVNGHLELLYGSKHYIYNSYYFTVDGIKFFPLNDTDDNVTARICNVPFKGETAMSLYVPQAQEFDVNLSQKRKIEPKYFKTAVEVAVNKNLIDFYNSYPTSEIGDNFMTRWAMYANTPMNEGVKKDLYPLLKKAIDGKTELKKVETLLSFLHNFEYGYDRDIWGRDRAFFSEESIYYPKCDCEDHAILFSRLVRDLLGLKVILVFYPGHLAAAVHFNSDVTGDYIMLNNEKFVVCDPTYFGAHVGRTMPGMDNSGATVILLD